MKKFLAIALLFLASALAFGQDGRTNVAFYNATDSNLRFMLNGNPACSGDVIPNGYCTEAVNPGTYTASATNGRETTNGQTFTIVYGETYNYRVFLQNTSFTAPGLMRLSSLIVNYGDFSVDAPVQLITDGTKDATTASGKAYKKTLYEGTMPNGDAYIVGVGKYPFALSSDDNAQVTEGFRSALGGKVLEQVNTTVSGQPALASIIEATANGRVVRFALLTVFRGNTGYVFAFATYLDVQDTDMAAMKEFFRSATLN